MTILPKKKSSQPKPDRDSSGGVDNFTTRGLPQNQVSFLLDIFSIWLSPPTYEQKIIMADFLFTLAFTWNFSSAVFILIIWFILTNFIQRITILTSYGLESLWLEFWRFWANMTLGYIRNAFCMWSKCQVLQRVLTLK